MSKKEEFCTIANIGGKHVLQTPSGEIIKGIVFTRTYDGLMHEQSYVIAKLLVNIADYDHIEHNQ